MDYDLITTESQLREFCAGLADCAWIAVDTEFVSEGSYRPELCLIQVGTPRRLAIIDAVVIGDAMGDAADGVQPFWQAVVDGGHETIVHAGRSEMEFCLAAVGRLPTQLFDVQLAAGLAGIEYPAGYSTLVYKLLGESMQKHETRTDWRKRPLSKRQLDYAAEDAYYLSLVRNRIHARLTVLGRLGWLAEERQSWSEALCHDMSDERWRRLSGNSGLDPRSLAIVHELWKWREEEARRRNQPARRVLRDDLIVELAKRQTADVKRIRAVRGMERGDLARRLDQIAACIQKALRSRRRSVRRGIRGRRRRSFPCWGSSSLPPWAASAAKRTSRRISSAGPTTFATGSAGGSPAMKDATRGTCPSWRPAGGRSSWGGCSTISFPARTSVRIGDPAAEHPLILERSTPQ